MLLTEASHQLTEVTKTDSVMQWLTEVITHFIWTGVVAASVTSTHHG